MENKNGQGVFYGVIGVATLIVAIIGATFAYFSASVTAGGDNEITGQTLGGAEGGVLSLVVEKIEFSDTGASANDLVPTNITTATAQNAITAKCEATPGGTDTAKYTGCHLYRIVADAGSNIAGATLKLSTFTTSATVKSDWNHAIWSTTDAADATTYTLGTNVPDATGTGQIAAAQTVFANQAITAGTPKVYYMLVWVADDNAVQNTGDDNDATGSYAGTFELAAAGGANVKATFTAG